MFTKTQQFLLIFGASMLCLSQGAAVDSTDFVVEKQVESEEKTSELPNVPTECHQPKETGRCFALFYRYAYNVDTQKCEEFIYGGCAGNGNNFETKSLCEAKCLGKTTEEELEESTTVTSDSTTIPSNISTSD
ncbi:uncharacterized protein Dwil_GK15468 [Drosophila willistoni]|uniref:BPTI/Kunitz inhibitor domain-containing protein n=2 Tax=Drosophila willistoni TaxID=7260 RepID=B4MVC1_DROWI|nr:uncharacterized protein Dwil_GK15468 [Drosophila willistoni]